jgi:hypothetical protein
MVKNNTFNGINLSAIASFNEEDGIMNALIREK